MPVSGPSLPPPSVPPHGYPPSRPLTRHQLRTEQTKAEKERVAALNKVCCAVESVYPVMYSDVAIGAAIIRGGTHCLQV